MSTGKTHITDMQNRAPAEPWLRGYGFVQVLIVALVALGHTSTLPQGPGNREFLHHFGYDPSWLGVNVLFILAGFMAMRSLAREPGTLVPLSRVLRIFPYLAAYALLVVLLVYPLLGKPALSAGDLFRHLGLYAMDVLTCIDPGRKLPGLLDEANYQCVIQGAIWTFRWGVVAYVGITIASKLRLLESRTHILALAITAVSVYIGIYSLQVWGSYLSPDNLQPAARLGAMFAMGMALFAYRKKIFNCRLLIPVLLAATLIQFYLLPWTPLIEVFASGFWVLAAFALMRTSVAARLSPHKKQGFAIALYIFHWPIAQLILLSWPDITPSGLIAISLPAALVFSAALSIIITKLIPNGTQFRLRSRSGNHV